MDSTEKIGHTNKYAGMGKGKKELARDLAKYYKCNVNYSGSKRIMYIRGEASEEAIIAIKSQVEPSFKLVAQ